MLSLRALIGIATVFCGMAFHAGATIVVNPAMPIDRQLRVQLIQAREDNGTNPATAFGNASQRLAIENALDQIWAQAGIDIYVFPEIRFFDNSFALDDNGAGGTRPTSDLGEILDEAEDEGVLNLGNVINLVFVEHVPGFSASLSENTSAGLAFIGAPGITMFVGDNLLTFQNGRDVIASVAAHEIGHNLGLSHFMPNGSDNLMSSGGDTEHLTANQIAIARNSNLLIVIPEPTALALFAPGFALAFARRRRPSAT